MSAQTEAWHKLRQPQRCLWAVRREAPYSSHGGCGASDAVLLFRRANRV
jgi:hypothetical protein